MAHPIISQVLFESADPFSVHRDGFADISVLWICEGICVFSVCFSECVCFQACKCFVLKGNHSIMKTSQPQNYFDKKGWQNNYKDHVHKATVFIFSVKIILGLKRSLLLALSCNSELLDSLFTSSNFKTISQNHYSCKAQTIAQYEFGTKNLLTVNLL